MSRFGALLEHPVDLPSQRCVADRCCRRGAANPLFQLVAQIQQKQAEALCTPPISSQQSHHHYSHAFRNTLRDGDGRTRWPSIRPDVKLLRLDDAQWLSASPPRHHASPPRHQSRNSDLLQQKLHSHQRPLACSFCAGHHWKLRYQRILFALQRELGQAGNLISTTEYMLSQKLLLLLDIRKIPAGSGACREFVASPRQGSDEQRRRGVAVRRARVPLALRHYLTLSDIIFLDPRSRR
jgi:hypothetical protein